MSVSAIIVTRGNVDLDPIYASIPLDWEVVVWDNGQERVYVIPADEGLAGKSAPVSDLSVYGRYAAIEHASHECIYVQDDDCIVSDPQKIAHCWQANAALQRGSGASDPNDWLFANMPQEFRPNYPDSCLVGFGACFHRDLPRRVFTRFFETALGPRLTGVIGPKSMQDDLDTEAAMLHRTCDVVFTTLTPRVLVDVPVERMDYAFGADRMYNQPGHVEERTRVLEMARKVRDA